MNTPLSLFGILLLVSILLWAGKFAFGQRFKTGAWVSFGSGVSVSYILVHVLPELGWKQARFAAYSDNAILNYLEHHLYLVCLMGFLTYVAFARPCAVRGEKLEGAAYKRHLIIQTIGWSVYLALLGFLFSERIEARVANPPSRSWPLPFMYGWMCSRCGSGTAPTTIASSAAPWRRPRSLVGWWVT